MRANAVPDRASSVRARGRPSAPRRAAKRASDLMFAAISLVIVGPLFPIVAVAIKLDSPGPVFFTQERVGRDGKPFRIIKFRTMTHQLGVERMNLSPAGDPRTTSVVAVLRAWFVDELPQLLNVLRGEMSVVGPRPETPEYVRLYTEDERRVLNVRPGMSGPSVVEYSAREPQILAAQEDPLQYYVETLLHERLRADLEYVESWSFVTDVRLLGKTLGLVVRRQR
jgi:lipopolysaccharide/colanic/teichoic acid biosynthesis glycosyltransferase